MVNKKLNVFWWCSLIVALSVGFLLPFMGIGNWRVMEYCFESWLLIFMVTFLVAGYGRKKRKPKDEQKQ